jgi:hypothetical protein
MKTGLPVAKRADPLSLAANLQQHRRRVSHTERTDVQSDAEDGVRHETLSSGFGDARQ